MNSQKKSGIRQHCSRIFARSLSRNSPRCWRATRVAWDYQRKYEEIVAYYNQEKSRVAIEETFRRLTELMTELDDEQKRAVEEGLDEDELALFDLMKKENLGKAERERVKQASRELLASIKEQLAKIDRFWEKEQTKGDVKVLILNKVHAAYRPLLSQMARSRL